MKKPTAFIYKVTKTEGDWNRVFKVYYLTSKHSMPQLIGTTRAMSASYKGNEATVANFLAEKYNFKITDGYNLDRSDITIWEV